MFLKCDLAEASMGGPVINKDGEVTGMAFNLATRYPAVLPTCIIVKCMEMCSKFSSIAIPWHGLCLRTVHHLNMQCRDAASSRHKVDSGFLVNKVSPRSIAETYGIRQGDVIASFNGMNLQTLQQLYLLSLGWEFPKRKMRTGFADRVALKLQVEQFHERCGRTIRLPIEFLCFPLGTSTGGDVRELVPDADALEPQMVRQEADAWVVAQIDRALQFVNTSGLF